MFVAERSSLSTTSPFELCRFPTSFGRGQRPRQVRHGVAVVVLVPGRHPEEISNLPNLTGVGMGTTIRLARVFRDSALRWMELRDERPPRPAAG